MNNTQYIATGLLIVTVAVVVAFTATWLKIKKIVELNNLKTK